MAKQLQLRSGTTTQHNTFTGAVGEVTVDTTKNVPVVHDGVTVGGHPVAAKANTDGTISLIKKNGTFAGTINADGLFNNTLTSTNTNQALTAAQGKVLKDTLDTTTSSTFGVGQTWQNVTAFRASGVTYTNTTGKPKQVSVVVRDITGYTYAVYFFVNDTVVIGTPDLAGRSYGFQQLTITVPPTQTYKLETANLLHSWMELI